MRWSWLGASFLFSFLLANVAGVGVALMQLPVAQYPPITPPTVQVTTRYPGASAHVLADTVALPIEEQVNGVENMLYMQSTSASDGSYTLIVTFDIGTDPDFAQVLVQNRVAIALAVAAAAGPAAGRHHPEEVDRDPADRHPQLAGRSLRQPVPAQLCHDRTCRTSSPACPAWATSTSSAPASTACASG